MRIFNTLITLCLVTASKVALASYTLPDYEKLTLENGLTVYLMEQNEVPLIDASVVINVGAIHDGKQAGLSYLTSENLVLGTKSLSKSALDETVDFVGANLFSSTNLEFSTVGASFAKKDSVKILTILRDTVLSPRFDQEEFDKFKTRHALNLTQQKESPRAVINNYFNRLVFGNDGYGSIVAGDKASVEKLNISDLKRHHEKWYTANNAAVIIVGDFDAEQMKREVKSLFGGWKRSAQQTKTTVGVASAPDKAKVLLVNKGDARESTFLIGGKGIAMSNKDRVGISVINTILGGRFTSWLNDELRVNTGLTYGARSRFASYSQDGSFAISTFTKTETTIDAIDLALKTYARLWEKGIDEKTLASAKAYVKGQFPPRFETSGQLAGLLANMHGYGFNESYINTFEEQVDSLTTKKAAALIKKYFPKENLQFVVVGKADSIREALSKYGQVSEVDIQDIGFDIK